jgi:hypothetical protein
MKVKISIELTDIEVEVLKKSTSLTIQKSIRRRFLW